MITYGLVRTVGPYTNPAPQRYNRNNIVEERPYWTQTKTLPPNEYELRAVTDQNGYQNLENQVVQNLIKKKEQAMQIFNQSFGYYNVNVGGTVIPPTPENPTPDISPPSLGNPTPDVPVKEESTQVPISIGRPIDTTSVGTQTQNYGVDWTLVSQNPTLTNLAGSIASNFFSNALPIAMNGVSNLVSSGRYQIAFETMVRAVLGPNYSAPIIGAFRNMNDYAYWVQTEMQRLVQDYTINPVVDFAREGVSNAISKKFAETIDQAGMDLLLPTPTDGLIPDATVPNNWDLVGERVVGDYFTDPQILAGSGAAAISIWRAFLSALQLSPNMQENIIRSIPEGVAAAVGSGRYNFRNTEARQAGSGFYRQFLRRYGRQA